MIGNMSEYLNRPLIQVINEARRKVVTLEGARSVGKTEFAQTQLRQLGYSYVTLADEETYKNASSELTYWLGTLKLPVVIDEAQRIKGLPLAVKEIVDRLPSGHPQFILTGSSLINRNGLDGQDPLARRVERYTMDPLTQRELIGNRHNLIDDLWAGRINPRFEKGISREDLYERMRTGGFPEYALNYPTLTERARRIQIRADIDLVLGDNVLYGERLDRENAKRILSKLLCMPGGILNAASIGNELGMNRKTIDRYLSVFLHRFIIRALPNLRTAPNRQSSFARAKIHPVDTALSTEVLLDAGVDLMASRVDYGNLFESFAINQLMPPLQWASDYYTPFYWRDSSNKPKEVDFVLYNRGRIIGVEMKSAAEIDREDFKGLAKLRDTDPRFTQGYVVYTGERVIDWSKDFWALPITALWEPDAFLYD